MFDPQTQLLSRHLAQLSEQLAGDPTNAQAWESAAQVTAPSRAHEPELARIVDTKDAAGLRALVEGWSSGATQLPELDRQLLRRAMKAFKKSLKVTRLDEESGIGGGAMSKGRRSSVVGITPPRQFPREVWDELVRQKRLRDDGHGIYEIAAGGEQE